MKIALTPLQRLNVRQVIRAQQPGNFDELETLQDILTKIEFPEEVMALLLVDAGNGTAIVDQGMLKTMDPLEVELEKAEAKLLRKIMEPGERFRPGVVDLVWLKPLREALAKG